MKYFLWMIIVDFVFVFIGGFLGTLARYGIEVSVSRNINTKFMLATFISNCLGCFLAGFLMPFSALDGWVKHGMSFLSVGFCGSLTTFGGYSYSVMLHLEKPSKALLGLGDFLATVVSCFVFVVAGYYFSSKIVFPLIPKPKKGNNEKEPEENYNDGASETGVTADNQIKVITEI